VLGLKLVSKLLSMICPTFDRSFRRCIKVAYREISFHVKILSYAFIILILIEIFVRWDLWSFGSISDDGLIYFSRKAQYNFYSTPLRILSVMPPRNV